MLRGSAPELPDQQLLQRFVGQADEAAFADLLERHGPFVLRVCRRLALDEHDAEDAFQVTFLELASRAGSIRRSEALAGWLFRVAQRVSGHARAAAVRRKREERNKVSDTETRSEVERREGDVVLHEEVDRLPRKYRDPVLLCYWNGKSNEEAATELGWPIGTVKIRLTRARDLLRARLSRRGMGLAAAAIGMLGQEAAQAALPAALRSRTLEAVGMQLAGKVLVGEALPASAARLFHELARTTMRARLRIGAALLLALGVAGGAAALGIQAVQQVHDEPNGEAPVVAQRERQPAATAPFLPRVVPPDSRKPLHVSTPGEDLPVGAATRIGTLRLRHEDFVYGLGYSTDGKHLFSFAPQALRVWDAATGKLIREILPPTGLAIQGLTKTGAVQVVDYQAGTESHMPVDWAKELGVPAFRWAAAPIIRGMAQGDRLRILDNDTGKELGKVPNPWAGLYGAPVLSLDGTLAAGAANLADGTVHVWELATGKELLCLKQRATSVSISPDGKSLAVGSLHAVRLYDIQTGRELPVSADSANANGTAGLAFLRKSQQFASLDPLGIVRIHDPATGRQLREFATEGNGQLIAHAFSSDGALLATMRGSPVLVWDVATGKRLGQFGAAHCFAFSPDCKHLLTTIATQQEVQWWNIANGQKERSFVYRSKLLQQEQQIAGDVDGHSGPDKQEQMARHRLIELGLAFHSVMRLGFSADGQALALRVPEQTVVWDVPSGISVQDLPTSLGAHLGITPDGRTLLHCLPEGGLALCEVATGKTRCDPRLPGVGIGTGTLAPDGRTLAVGTGPTIRLLDIVTGAVLATLNGHRGEVRELTFSADGKSLASASKDTTVLIWDVSKLSAREALPPIAGPLDLQALWHDLANEDGPRAYQAVVALANTPEQSVPFLSKAVRPVLADETQRLNQAIERLGSPNFSVRQQAIADLEKVGPAGRAALRRALEAKPPLEVRQRLERLLERALREAPTGEHLRTLRAVEALELMGTPGADKVLQMLAKGDPHSELTHQALAALQRRETGRGRPD